MRLDVAGRSDPGKVRTRNEDRFAVQHNPKDGSTLCVLADGMGGYASGNLAATIAVETTLAEVRQGVDLASAVAAANAAVFERATREPEHQGMGTTMAGALIGAAHEQVIVAHVGDSRAYLIRKGRAIPLTTDHSWVMEEVRAGHLTADEAQRSTRRNLLTRALGVDAAVAVDTGGYALEPGDAVLLCSDGVHGLVSDDELAAACAQPAAAGAASLVELVLGRGAPDNATVVIARLVQDDVAESATPITRPLPDVTEPPSPRDGSRQDVGNRPSWRLVFWLVAAVLAVCVIIVVFFGARL